MSTLAERRKERLQKRYENGEISEEQYNEMLNELNGSSSVVQDVWEWAKKSPAEQVAALDRNGIDYEYVDDRNLLQKGLDATGLTSYKKQNDAAIDAEISLENTKKDAEATYDTIADAMGGSDSITAFRDAVNDFDPSAYGVDLFKLTDYNYGKTVADFMDPAAEYRINKSVEATQNAMAGQGGLSGGAAARQLQAVASEAASDEYNNAYERLLKDQELDYGKTKDLISAEQANSNLGLNAANAKLSNLGTVNDNYVNALLAAMQSDANLSTALAQLGIDSANAQSAFGQILGAVKDGSQIYANLSA